jgi:hypothetical protein
MGVEKKYNMYSPRMLSEENKAITRFFYKKANKHNMYLTAEFVVPDFVENKKIESLEIFKQFRNVFIKGFPDFV